MSKPKDYPADFYIVGGTMNPEAPSYIERSADQEIVGYILAGEFCCVLTPRQMGKSSLMARTANHLKKEGCRTAILDLSQIGTQKGKESEEKWYYGITHSIVRELGLEVNLSSWWRERDNLPALQRLMEFFEDVLLPSTKEAVVIFVDEIDTTIALPFTDDFFAAVRSCYNSRATKNDYRRLNFVLLGVAGPSDLIKDTRRTPFNIGHRIHLTDFTLEEAQPLAQGLCPNQGQAMDILKRILFWSSGHPYLTQKLCHLVARKKMDTYSESEIDAIVGEHFLSPAANREESNLKFVSQRLLCHKRAGRKQLLLYRKIYGGKSIDDDPLSPVQTGLKLSGLVTAREDRRLAVRNRIYKTAFNRQWVKEVMPVDWNRNIAVVAAAILFIGFITWYTLFLPKPYIEAIFFAQEDIPTLAYEKLRKLPFYKTTANELLADYWERRALRSLSEEKRDAGLLYRLKALTINDTQNRRGEVAEIIGEDYAKLKATYRYYMDVNAVAFSPDGKTVLTNGRLYENYTTYLCDVATGKLLALMKHDHDVNSLVFSPDGKKVLTGGYGNTARLWDADTGKQLALMKHDDTVSSVAFSPDGKKMLTECYNTAHLWDSASGKQVAVMKYDAHVTSIAFSPDGSTLLTGHYDQTVRLWDADTGKQLALMKHDDYVNSVAFNHDGKILLNKSEDKAARLWDAASGKPLAIILHYKIGTPVAFSPDGKNVLTGSGGTVKEAFSPDGKNVLTGSGGTVHLWDAAIGKLQPPIMKHDDSIWSVDFSPDGTILLTGSDDKTARLWDADTGKQLALIKHDDTFYSAAFSPDGKKVLTESRDKTARVWDAVTGKPLAVLKHEDDVTSVAFSADGKRVLTRSRKEAWLWDAVNGKPLAGIKHDLTIIFAAFSPDGKTLFTADWKTARLWDVANGKPLAVMKIDDVTSVAFSLDGKKVLTGCVYGEVRLWDAATGKPLAIMDDGKQEKLCVYYVALSPDGTTLLTLGRGPTTGQSENNTVCRWDVATGKPLYTKEYPNPITWAFSSDGKTMLIGCNYTWEGSMVELLDVVSGKSLAVMRHDDFVRSVAFSPDGKSFMVATDWWIHQSIISGNEIKPKASRLLPGSWTGTYRFLDGTGDRMQVVVKITADSLNIIELRFDRPTASPIQGDPKELLDQWQKKLALILDEETGKIEPMYTLPNEKE